MAEHAQVPVAHCAICQSEDCVRHLDDHAEDLDVEQFGSSRKEVSHGRILRCRSCGFGFRETRPCEDQLAGIYRAMDTGQYETEAAGRARTAARHLKIVQRYYRSGRILDVGCAGGLFLRFAQRAGWKVAGLEPSEALCQQARKMLKTRGEVYCTTLERANLPAAAFDAITLWDVLEHVPNPVALLKKCRSLLKAEGHLFVNTPDLDSLQARLMGPRWPLLLAEHLNYFNLPSLRLCGQLAGIEWLQVERRPAFFTVDYILHRLSQHQIPGAALAHRIAKGRLGKLVVPVYLGEICAVGSQARCSKTLPTADAQP